MSDSTNIMTADQLANWDFGGGEAIEAPAGYDPDAVGLVAPPPGWHQMELYDFSIEPDQTFRFRSDSCVIDKFIPKFRVVADKPHAGALVTDFLPAPTRGRHMLP